MMHRLLLSSISQKASSSSKRNEIHIVMASITTHCTKIPTRAQLWVAFYSPLALFFFNYTPRRLRLISDRWYARKTSDLPTSALLGTFFLLSFYFLFCTEPDCSHDMAKKHIAFFSCCRSTSVGAERKHMRADHFPKKFALSKSHIWQIR